MPVRDTNSRVPSRRTGYTFLNQGTAAAGASQATMGKHVLRRMPGVDFWSPSWGEETIIRILPATNPDNRKQFDPYRLSTQYCDFGDWIRVYEAVRNFGNPGVTMLLHDGLNQSYDAQLMNPCWILYRAIQQSVSQGQGLPEWFPLLQGGRGKSAVLSKPTKLYLVQCSIFRHKSKDTFSSGNPPLGLKADGPTIVMGLPPTAGESLIQMLEEKTEDWKGDPDDPEQYKYGDLVSTDKGSFVHIYELGKDPRARFNTTRGPAGNVAAMYAQSQAATPQRGAPMEAKGYGVFITKTLDGGDNDIPADFNGLEDLVRSKFKPWEDILEFKTDEEQAHLIAPLFPPSAILYAWRDHQSWIPDSVQEAGRFEMRKPVSASPAGVVQTNPWANKQQPQPRSQPRPVEPDPVEDEASEEDFNSPPEIETLTSVSTPVSEDAKVAASRERLEKANRERAKRNQS